MQIEEPSEVEAKEETAENRPDPAFKFLTRQLADQLGLKTLETEFPQTLRADLVLAVPENLNLENTLFSFFRAFNVIEFKGQTDHLDEREFVKNETRTNLLFLQEPSATFENILNVIISSRLPQRFFDYMSERDCIFRTTPDEPWLWRCRVGLQDVVVIVCRDLPLEQRYFEWLVFAPASTRKWQNFVRLLAREHNWRLLDQVRGLRPKEFEMMNLEIKELLAEYTPKERKRHLAEWAASVGDTLAYFADEIPEELTEMFSSLSVEQRQKLLKLLLEQEKKAE